MIQYDPIRPFLISHGAPAVDDVAVHERLQCAEAIDVVVALVLYKTFSTAIHPSYSSTKG
jgi:hypothetical protein